MCECVGERVGVCERERERDSVCVCVCVCVCVITSAHHSSTNTTIIYISPVLTYVLTFNLQPLELPMPVCPYCPCSLSGVL